MNINKSFSYIFDDPQWTGKIAIGALIGMIPILNFAWAGYLVEIVRRAMRDDPEPLPDWNDLGKLLGDGLLLFLAGLVYALPIIVLVCLPLGFMIIPAALSDAGGRMEDIAQALAAAGGVLFLGSMCVFFGYGLVLSVIYPAIQVLFAREGTLASCFKLGAAVTLIRQNSGPYFTVWLLGLALNFGVSLLAGAAGGVVGMIPCIGWIASLVITLGPAMLVTSIVSHLVGQFGALTDGPSRA